MKDFFELLLVSEDFKEFKDFDLIERVVVGSPSLYI